MERIPISGLTVHPQCELIPRMRPDEWTQFTADVEQHGVLEPIVVQRGGIVLDGRQFCWVIRRTSVSPPIWSR